MANHIIEKINAFSTYKFDEKTNKIVNLKDYENTNIDEFLDIQFLLDCNRVMYYFEKNFEIKIIR